MAVDVPDLPVLLQVAQVRDLEHHRRHVFVAVRKVALKGVAVRVADEILKQRQMPTRIKMFEAISVSSSHAPRHTHHGAHRNHERRRRH